MLFLTASFLFSITVINIIIMQKKQKALDFLEYK